MFKRTSKFIEIDEGRPAYALRKTIRLGGPLLAIVAFWVILGQVGLLPNWLYDTGCLVLSVLLFILAIPLGVLLRLDLLPSQLGMNEGGKAVVLCLLTALVNIFLVHFLRSFLQRMNLRESLTSAKEKSPNPSPLQAIRSETKKKEI